MRHRTYANGVIIFDDMGCWVMALGVDFPPDSIVPPNGAAMWRTDLGMWCSYTAGAWSVDTVFAGNVTVEGNATLDGTLSVAGLSSSGVATFDGGIEVYGAGDDGGVKTYAISGGDAVAAHAHEGVITVDLDLAGAASQTSAAEFIPARTMVWRSAVEVLVGFTGGSVTKFDVGIVGGTGAEFFSDVSMIDALDFNASVSSTVVTANNAGAQLIVNAQQAGGAAATVTTGKVRVTLWLSSIDGPDGVVYA